MMKARYINVLLLIVILISSGCQTKTKPGPVISLPGTWRLHSEEPLNSGDVLSDVSSAANVISFFTDGSYTRFTDSGSLHVGRWNLSEAQHTISFDDSGKLSRPCKIVLDVNKFGRETFIVENSSQNKRAMFIKEFEPLSNFRNDPLYPENNTWRYKPASPLSSDEIRAKIANYVRHLVLILKAAKDRNQEVVSFEFSKGPVKIYNGGIGVYPFNSVPSTWKQSFYNEAEALKGYQMYAGAVGSTHYNRAGSGDWVDDDFRILNAIYAVLLKSK
jgi:hypothetical protein